MSDTETLTKPGGEATIGDITSAGVFQAHLEQFAGLTDRARALKEEGWRLFESLPMPSRKDELWRFANLSGVSLEGFRLLGEVSDAERRQVIGRSRSIEKVSGSIVFADNQLLEHQPVNDELAKRGVIWEPLEVAFERHPELVEQYFLNETTHLGSVKFVALHQAYCEGGYLLYVPPGVELEDPFVAYHWAVEPRASLFPHTLVVAGDNAKVSVIDLYQSANDEPAMASGVGDIHAGRGARVFRQALQGWNEQSLSWQVDNVVAERDASVKTLAVNLGAKRARFENTVRIAGAGAHVRLYSLTVADREQEFDQRTLQIHEAPHATSDLLYKNALLDEARTIFSGLIRVDKHAQQTDAYQTNRNLQLSDSAEACSLPGLEIEANDVKCSHGATTGRLDPTELFYMLSRGIPRQVAYELMVFGFFEEILLKVDNEEVAGYLREAVQEKFRSREQDLIEHMEKAMAAGKS